MHRMNHAEVPEESPVQAHVDLDAGIIYRRGKREKDRKTKRRPLVKLPDRLQAHMRRWRALDLARMADRKVRGQPTSNAVIHMGGLPLAGRIRTGFAALVADAGLDPDITPHWMRHSAATWLMQADCSVWDAAGYLGMTPSVLENHYGHHRPSHQNRARKAIG